MHRSWSGATTAKAAAPRTNIMMTDPAQAFWPAALGWTVLWTLGELVIVIVPGALVTAAAPMADAAEYVGRFQVAQGCAAAVALYIGPVLAGAGSTPHPHANGVEPAPASTGPMYRATAAANPCATWNRPTYSAASAIGAAAVTRAPGTITITSSPNVHRTVQPRAAGQNAWAAMPVAIATIPPRIAAVAPALLSSGTVSGWARTSTIALTRTICRYASAGIATARPPNAWNINIVAGTKASISTRVSRRARLVSAAVGACVAGTTGSESARPTESGSSQLSRNATPVVTAWAASSQRSGSPRAPAAALAIAPRLAAQKIASKARDRTSASSASSVPGASSAVASVLGTTACTAARHAPEAAPNISAKTAATVIDSAAASPPAATAEPSSPQRMTPVSPNARTSRPSPQYVSVEATCWITSTTAVDPAPAPIDCSRSRGRNASTNWAARATRTTDQARQKIGGSGRFTPTRTCPSCYPGADRAATRGKPQGGERVATAWNTPRGYFVVGRQRSDHTFGEPLMKRLPVAIWAMVIGAFAMGADEFIVAGVVREIAVALDVTIGTVGHLESVYALGVAIGAPLFTALGTRFGRRSMLLATTGVFLLGNLLSALAPTYEAIMAGRVVAAMAHGAFLGIAAVFAAEMVDPARKGRAVAVVFSGLTASTVLGAPIGACLLYTSDAA